MRIGLDASTLVKEATGIGQWITHVIYNLMQIDEENEYFLFTHDEIKIPYELKPNWEIVYYGGKKKRMYRYLTHVPKLIRKYKLDVFVGTKHYLPPFNKRNVKYLAVVHDLIPLYRPELFTWKHRLRFRFFTQICKWQAHQFVAVSNATKRDVIKYLKAPEDQIHVIYEAANPDFNTDVDPQILEETLRKYHVDENYVLCLSTVEPRKNMLRAIQAYEKCILGKQLPYKLVIVGGSGWNNGEIYEYVQSRPELKPHVLFTGYVTNKEVKYVYAGASLFVYPSLCEGFGLPVLEAMQSGIPVITSNVSSLPEAAGDAAILVDPYSLEEIEDAMTRILSSEELQRQLREKGLAQAAKFSWRTCAEELLAVIRSMGVQ